MSCLCRNKQKKGNTSKQKKRCAHEIICENYLLPAKLPSNLFEKKKTISL